MKDILARSSVNPFLHSLTLFALHGWKSLDGFGMNYYAKALLTPCSYSLDIMDIKQRNLQQIHVRVTQRLRDYSRLRDYNGRCLV